MNRKNKATIEINLPSENMAKIIYLSLKPELSPKTQMTVEDNLLTLNLKADTVAMLRALVNSHLRWIATLNNTMEAINVYQPRS